MYDRGYFGNFGDKDLLQRKYRLSINEDVGVVYNEGCIGMIYRYNLCKDTGIDLG